MRRVLHYLLPYILTSLALCAAGIAAHVVTTLTPVVVVSLFFVPVVLMAALPFGIGPAIFAVVATVLLARYFFYAPIFSFAVDDPVQLLDLVIFTGTAALVGPLADWARRSARNVKQRETRLQQLYEAGRDLAAVAETAQIPFAIVKDVRRTTGHACALVLSQQGTLRLVASTGGEAFEAADQLAAERLWQAVTEAGAQDPVLTPRWRLHAVLHGKHLLGLLAIAHEGQPVEPLFLPALLELIATALERMQAAERSEAARINAKADHLREAIIGSISHDLRTPLAAILGSASTLEAYGSLCSEAERAELVAAIREQAERLDRFLGRLLDLTRIRAGHLQPALAPTDVSDVIEGALRHTKQLLDRHRVEVSLPKHLAMPQADAVLLQQALVNILENAAKYAPPGSSILIGAFRTARIIELFVRDSGRGLTPEQCMQIFDRFYRVADSGAEPSGTGLGLTISRAFIEACNGSVEAESPGPNQGTTIRIRLPLLDDDAQPAISKAYGSDPGAAA